MHRYHTFEEAQVRLQAILEEVYDTKRFHSSLNDVPLDEFEAGHLMYYYYSWS